MTKISTWSANDINWDMFDLSQVDQHLLDSIKVACLVEARGDLYGKYLHDVFKDDDKFKSILIEWGEDEKKHGDVLKSWIQLADPSFDFDKTFQRFISMAGWPQPVNGKSFRGNNHSELISRCIVESATSAFYYSTYDKTEEPLLKVICKNIARDEIRHYNLFKSKLDSEYKEKQSLFSKLKAMTSRLREATDDQLSMAFFCVKNGAEYDRYSWSKAMQRTMFSVYNEKRANAFIMLNLKLLFNKPRRILVSMVSWISWRLTRLNMGGIV